MYRNFIAVVMRPCLTELLGKGASPATISYHGGIIVAIQMFGWGLGGLTLGVVGDYFGRARTLALSIFVYAVFTGICAVAPNWWMLALFRFFAGWGIGSEWAVGTALINETWPARSRVVASGIMAASFGFGALVAGFVNLLIGTHGWRLVFLVGIIPAILVSIVRRRIPESKKWEETDARRREIRGRMETGKSVSEAERNLAAFTLVALFKKPWRRSVIAGLFMAFAVSSGYWGSMTWLPAHAANLAIAAKANPVEASMWVWIVCNCGTVVFTLIFAMLTDTIGRRGSFILTCVLSMAVLAYVYLGVTNYHTLYFVVPLLGIVSGGFGIFAVWLPEMFPTHLRSTGASFCYNVARIGSCAGPFIGGSLVLFFGSIPKAACAMGASFIIGLIAVMFAPETKGKPLQE